MTETKRETTAASAEDSGMNVAALNPGAKKYLQGFIAGVTAAEKSEEKEEEEKK